MGEVLRSTFTYSLGYVVNLKFNCNCLLLVVFIVPFLMALTLWKYRDVIDRPDMIATYGFLTKGYRSEYYYWEIITMYRKSILVLGSIFLNTDPFISVMKNILRYLCFKYIILIGT